MRPNSFTASPETTRHPALQDAVDLFATGKFARIKTICVTVLESNPEDDNAYFWNGLVAAADERHGDAVQNYEKAIAINSRIPDYHANLGRSLIKLKRTREARTAADQATALNPINPLTLDTLGVIYSFVGCHERAAEIFRRATELQPENDGYWYNLGASLKFSGDFDGAEFAYDRALAINPEHDKALAALSHLRSQTVSRNHIAVLEKRLTRYTGKIMDEMRLSYALAKEYDDVDRYDDAFNILADCSKRWRQSISYTFNDDKCIFDALIESFTPESIAKASPGYESEEPIFITGMPRTGTTLTDRIISSHSEVYSAGELNKMGLLLRVAAQARSNPDFKPAIVRHLLKGSMEQLGERYVAETRPATGHTPRFIDKMPLNFLYIGFILLALPHAKVITLRRNPLDTCMGNFRQLFSLRSSYYAYSYDLLDCGRYYIQFDRLMRHWRELFPNRICEVSYEYLVENQESATRDLIDFCGLNWQDQCLHFEKNSAPVATASSAQVREGMNTKGLDRWKNYEQHLEPLVNLLLEHDIDV